MKLTPDEITSLIIKNMCFPYQHSSGDKYYAISNIVALDTEIYYTDNGIILTKVFGRNISRADTYDLLFLSKIYADNEGELYILGVAQEYQEMIEGHLATLVGRRHE